MRSFLITSIFLMAASAVSAQSVRALQYFEKGIHEATRQRFAAARDAFGQARIEVEREGASDRFLATLRYNLGVAHYRLGKFEAAVAEFKSATRYAPLASDKAQYSLGMALTELGRFEEARAAFETAIRLKQRNGEAWFDIAFVYLRLNDRVKAQKAFSNAIRYASVDSAMGHNNLGVLFALEGRMDRAEQEFELAAKTARYDMPEINNNIEAIRRIVVRGDELVASDLKFTHRNSLLMEN